MKITRCLVFVLIYGYVTQAMGAREFKCEPVSKPRIMLNNNYWFETSSGQGMLCGADSVAGACANGTIVWRNEEDRPFVKCNTNGPKATWEAIVIAKVPTCSANKAQYDKFIKLGNNVFFYKYVDKANRYKIAEGSYCQIPATNWCIGGKWNSNGQCHCENGALDKNTGKCPEKVNPDDTPQEITQPATDQLPSYDVQIPAPQQTVEEVAVDDTTADKRCNIGNQSYLVGMAKKLNTKFYVCKETADCDKIPASERLPNATKLRCSGAKGTTCGLCIAETCNDNFTVKHVNGQNYGFCISKAEQGCIDAVGDKKWNNKTKTCDCGEKVWNATDNTCADATNAEVKSDPIVETPAESVTCEESKGLKPSPTEPGKCVCINAGWQIDDATGTCVEPVAELTEVTPEAEIITPVEPEMVSADDELTAAQRLAEEERQRAEEERKRAEQERKNAEQQRKDTEQTYKSAREKEQSWANKAVTAASTGATGLGLMQLASGYAEQKADKEAEEDMAEYITTMKCEYGGGHQVDLGNAEITLPGWEVLSENREKFKTLADQVKATKTALNLRPGIESEVLYERADTGLYEYENVGKTGGSNVSVARALRDSHSEDAAAWAEQKQEAKDQMKKGGITAAVGVGVGALGNVAINTDAGQKAMQKIGEFFTKDSE